MKKTVKIIIITVAAVLALLIAAAAVIFGLYWHQNTHWYDKYTKAIDEVGAVEKQFVLPSGHIINYGEVENDKPALLLIHGQMASWEDYALTLPELSKNWHIYAVDVYGHGESTHDESLYYIDVNGDDIITFINEVICGPTVVSGHSNGALTAAYVAAYGGSNIAGAVLEDPPVFSTEGESWEESFAYLDTYKNLHDYDNSDKSECWEAYYLRRCLWGQLFMKDSMPGIANYAQKYHDEHPGEPVKIGFMPYSTWSIFQFAMEYDFAYGEHFYNLTWNNGHTHKQILSDIEVPCVFIHAKESVSENGIYMCASKREQAERAVSYIGDNCTLVETSDSEHTVHTVHMDDYLNVVNSFLK